MAENIESNHQKERLLQTVADLENYVMMFVRYDIREVILRYCNVIRMSIDLYENKSKE